LGGIAASGGGKLNYRGTGERVDPPLVKTKNKGATWGETRGKKLTTVDGERGKGGLTTAGGEDLSKKKKKKKKEKKKKPAFSTKWNSEVISYNRGKQEGVWHGKAVAAGGERTTSPTTPWDRTKSGVPQSRPARLENW